MWSTAKGFVKSPENPVAEEPCRCLPGFQCYPINCEYCEIIPTCSAGYGLELDPGETRLKKQKAKMAEPCVKIYWNACCQPQSLLMEGRNVFRARKAFSLLATTLNNANNGRSESKYPHTHTNGHRITVWNLLMSLSRSASLLASCYE